MGNYWRVVVQETGEEEVFSARADAKKWCEKTFKALEMWGCTEVSFVITKITEKDEFFYLPKKED